MSKRSLIMLLILIIATVVVTFQMLFGKNSLQQQRRVSKEIAAYQQQIDSLQHVIEERNAIIERLKTDSLYQEEVIRTRFGMSRKGEKVFQLVE